jgi:hypothetical protein
MSYIPLKSSRRFWEKVVSIFMIEEQDKLKTRVKVVAWSKQVPSSTWFLAWLIIRPRRRTRHAPTIDGWLQRATRYYIPEDKTLQNHRWEDLISYLNRVLQYSNCSILYNRSSTSEGNVYTMKPLKCKPSYKKTQKGSKYLARFLLLTAQSNGNSNVFSFATWWSYVYLEHC